MSKLGLIYSRTLDEWNAYSLNEVLTLLQDDEQLQVGTVIYSCEPQYAEHSDFFDAESVIYDADNRAYGEYQEHAELYLEKVTDEAKAELQRLLIDWANRNVAEPLFYHCSNIQPVTVTQGMIDTFLHP